MMASEITTNDTYMIFANLVTRILVDNALGVFVEVFYR